VGREKIMSKVVVMRGIPGSGKSTYVEERYPDATVLSADHFFEELGKFDSKLLPMAHSKCFHEFLLALDRGDPLIVVDNTNVHVWEFINYVHVAMMMGHSVEVISIMAKTIEEVKTCVGRNLHEVGSEAISHMALEFERYDRPHSKNIRVSKLDDGRVESV